MPTGFPFSFVKRADLNCVAFIGDYLAEIRDQSRRQGHSALRRPETEDRYRARPHQTASGPAAGRSHVGSGHRE